MTTPRFALILLVSKALLSQPTADEVPYFLRGACLPAGRKSAKAFWRMSHSPVIPTDYYQISITEI
jgi:hypothetical protein